ncbi:uncharacterized protein EV422DRAFT_546377 [Fimicolochytrium jonesii]|uniref:uncharacterized protein n=1 Tax=Fimicolochytrium jonesii TaxID=1396493 RepID=UPI0022FEFAB0|nr:uncharacterized protein EV422DRAFT_546377 [Fimicolochytrium jonesii]KAI8816351.1 hypothetical protein EV422DRAFT_546377 [Fimicolochytrium jonesii]
MLRSIPGRLHLCGLSRAPRLVHPPAGRCSSRSGARTQASSLRFQQISTVVHEDIKTDGENLEEHKIANDDVQVSTKPIKIGVDSGPVAETGSKQKSASTSSGVSEDDAVMFNSGLSDFRSALTAGKAKHAWAIFRSMERNDKLDGLGWRDYNALMKVARMFTVPIGARSKLEQALIDVDWIMSVMGRQGIKPNAATYAALASAAALCGDVDRVRTILQTVADKGWVLDHGGDMLLLAQAQTEPHQALESFGAHLKKNPGSGSVAVYNSLLDNFSVAEDHHRFQQLLMLGKEHRLPPSAMTYDILTQHFAVRVGDLNEATAIMEQRVQQGYGRSIKAYTALIAGYHSRQDYVKVMELFKEVEKHGLPPTIRLLNFIMSANSKLGNVKAAARIFFRILSNPDLQANALTYKTLSNALKSWPDSFESLVKSIRQKPTRRLYVNVVRGMFDAEADLMTQRVAAEYRDMCRLYPNHYRLDDKLLTIEHRILCSYGRREEAESIWAEHFSTSRHLRNKWAYQSMMSLYGHQASRDPRRAREVFDEAKASGLPVDLFAYNALLKTFWYPSIPLNSQAIGIIREAIEANVIGDISTLPHTHLMQKAITVIGKGNVVKGYQALTNGEELDMSSLPIWSDMFPGGHEPIDGRVKKNKPPHSTESHAE